MDTCSALPAVPGVYALWSKRRCLYVGMSRRSLRSRCYTHVEQLSHHGITHITWVRSARPPLDECLYIFALDPALNSTRKEPA